MKVKLLFIVFILSYGFSFGQSIWDNPITGTNPNTSNPYIIGQNVATNITVSGLGRSSGIVGTNANNRYNANSWNTPSIDLTAYFEFTLTPNSGFSINFVNLIYNSQASASSPVSSFAIRSSVDSYASNIATPSSTGGTINLSAAAFQGVNSAISFRIYGWGTTSSTSTFSIDDFIFNGTVVAAGITTAAAGDWYTGSTWTGGVVPTSAENAIVRHFVTASANITRNAGTVTTINLTVGKLTMTGASYIGNGTTNVNGTFQLDNGSWATSAPTGNYFSYGSAGTLNFNTTGNYNVFNSDVFWPPGATAPFNVNVLNGGINMINASRTVEGTFSTANVAPTPPVLGIQLTSTVLRLNGTIRINAGGFFANAPIYGPASTLVYAPGGIRYGRGPEWNPVGPFTIGTTFGYPNNVQITNNTVLDYPNGGTPGIKAIDGNLQVDGGSSFYMDFGAITTGGVLIVKKDLLVGGNLTLGFASGDDIKVGGDLKFNTGFNFNANNRSVFLTKAGVQTLTATSATPVFHYLNFDLASGTTLKLDTGSDLKITAPLGNNIITWQTGNTIDLNSRTLTLGTVGLNSVFNGTANFSGTTTSTLILQGNDDIGTLKFNSGFQNLGTLTINRPSTTVGCSLGSPLVITSALNMTSGKFDVGNNPLTLGATITSVAGANATNFIIADGEVSPLAAVRKIFSAAGNFTFPIGDRAASNGGSQYSPVSVVLTSGSFSSTSYVSATVYDIVHPDLNAATDYLTRYWNIGTFGITGFTTFNATATYLATPGTDIVGNEANYLVNRFDGTDWTTNGTGVNAVAKTFVSEIAQGSTNNITAGFRNAKIVVKGVIGANPTIANGDMVASGLDNTLYATTTVAVTKTFRIVNSGNETLTVTGITQSGAGDFTIDAILPYTIPGGSSVEFDITFLPLAAGVRTAIISIFSNDTAASPYTYLVQGTGSGAEIEVYGNGVPINTPDTTPSLLDNTDFGLVDVVAGSATRIFSISNTGDISLNISSVTITGAHAADFTITTSPVGSLPGRTGEILTIVFDPSVVGLRTATVTIFNDDPNEGTYTFAIQGTGIDYVACGLGPFQIIAQNTFEPTPASLYLSYTQVTDPAATAATESSISARGQDRAFNTPAYIGTRSLVYKGYSGSSISGGTKKGTTITFATTDVSQYKEVSLRFNLGGYGTNSTQGPDVSDKVLVLISTNGGTTWSEELDISGSSSSIWDINTGTGSVQWTYDGNNISASYSAAFGSTNTGPKAITISNLPSSTQLRVRLIFYIDRTDEILAVDNVVLEGKKPLISTYTNSPGPTWTPGPPTSSTVAIIDGDYNTSYQNINACACEIKPTRTVTINANQYLNIESDITNSGTIIVESAGSLVQRNDDAVNTGTAYTVKRTTPPFNRFDYTYWCAPVSGPLVTIGNVFSAWRTDYAFTYTTINHEDLLPPFGFDDNQDVWQIANLVLPMVKGKGYAIMGQTTGVFPATATAVFSGAVNNGKITTEVKVAPNGYGQNLVGNPYPSAVYADQFIYVNAVTNPYITGTLYFWTHKTPIAFGGVGPDTYNFTANDYAMYNLSGPIGTGAGSPSVSGSAAPSGYIASGQGFFVDAKVATNLIFNNKMRDKSFANTNFFRYSSPNVGELERDRIWLNMTSVEGLFSQQLIGYFENTTNDYDVAYDGLDNPSSNAISFYSLINTDKYRIQGRGPFENTDRVQLGYSSAVAKSYSIEIDRTEGQLSNADGIYLEDNLLNITHNLKDSAYTFATEIGTFEDRFTLKYTDETLGSVSNDFLNNILIVSTKSTIDVKSKGDLLEKVTVYDLLGRIIYKQGHIQAENLTINTLLVGVQPLIVQVVLANGQQVTKKIVFGME